MELKDWLNRGYGISKRLTIKKAYLESLGNIISNYEPREIDRDQVENSSETIAIRWSETNREVDELKRRLLKIDLETDRVLRKLKDSNQYQVLFCRYVRRLTWDEIAEATNYSKPRVFSLHREGKEELDRITCYQEWEDDYK